LTRGAQLEQTWYDVSYQDRQFSGQGPVTYAGVVRIDFSEPELRAFRND
jgi:hypothetical protein